MLIKKLIFLMPAVFALLLVFNSVCPGEMILSDSSQQKEVDLTVYNSGIGLVKDRRDLSLGTGIQKVIFTDVASKIVPSSVHVSSLAKRDSLQVLEQQYEYDLLSSEKLLDKFVGKEVELENGVKALVIANHNGPVFKIGDKITFDRPTKIFFPKLPDGIAAQPSLVWLVKNSLQKQSIEASYITEGMEWKTDYALFLNDAGNRADLTGWVTLDNHSGIAFNNAHAKLVAGEISRVREQGGTGRMLMAANAEAPRPQAVPASSVKEEGFSEYHIYTLDGPVNINDNETKQIAFIDSRNIIVKKQLMLKGESFYFINKYDNPVQQKVGVYLELVNSEKDGLGVPLPKGVIRVFRSDREGGVQLIGENSIAHTPKDEKLSIKTGDAFDVVAERKQMEWNKMSQFVYETTFEITLRNHGAEDVSVKVIEPIPGDWTILTASHVPRKIDAHTVEFTVPVPKNSETRLSYRTRVTN